MKANKKSLVTAKEKGINWREQIMKFYKDYYHGGLMMLVVIRGGGSFNSSLFCFLQFVSFKFCGGERDYYNSSLSNFENIYKQEIPGKLSAVINRKLQVCITYDKQMKTIEYQEAAIKTFINSTKGRSGSLLDARF